MASLVSNFAAGPYYTQNTGRQSMHDRNNGAMDSVAEREVNADGSMGMKSRLDAMKPYFGVPQRQVADHEYAWWETENYDLPDAFKGKNPYVLNIIITAILLSDMWPVTEMLPYKKKEDGLTINWDQWIFSDSMLGRTPEESTSRMTTNTQTSYAQHMIRNGKAFILEHGFWNTPKGQKNWAMNIIQIVNATTETACFGATHAIFTVPVYVDASERYNNRRERGMVDVDSIMNEQTDSFARVQKEEGGLATVLRKMDEAFRNRNGHEANYVVLPSGCDIAVRNRPENNYAIYNGQGVINPSISSGYSWTTRISRGYRVGEHSPNVDPHFSTVCIGGFHVLTNQAANLVPTSEYRTQHRTILIFSMSKDDFTPMELSHVFGYLGLYTDYIDGDHSCKLSSIGHAFLAKYLTWGNLLDRAGEKDRVLEKISLLSDSLYNDFMERFNKSSLLIPIDDQQVGQDVNWGQPTVAAGPTDTRQPTPLDAEIAKVVGRVGTNYIIFSGNKQFHIKQQGSNSNCHTTNTEAVCYAIASRQFLHFDIPYTGLGTITPAQACPGWNLRDDCHRVGCAKVLLSIAASILLGMIDHQRTIANGDQYEKVAAQSVAAFQKWMIDTVDISGLTSTTDSVAKLFNDKLDSRIQWKHMRQFRLQTPVQFVSLITYAISLASNKFANVKQGVDGFLSFVPGRLPTSGQPFLSSMALSDTHADDSLDPLVIAVNALKMKDQAKEKTTFEFIKRVKSLSEADLLGLAKIPSSDKVATDKHLAGFRQRFNAIADRIIAIHKVKSYTDEWYVRTMRILSRFRNTTIAAHFLNHIYDKCVGKIDAGLDRVITYFSSGTVMNDSETATRVSGYLTALNALHMPVYMPSSVPVPRTDARAVPGLSDVRVNLRDQLRLCDREKNELTLIQYQMCHTDCIDRIQNAKTIDEFFSLSCDCRERHLITKEAQAASDGQDATEQEHVPNLLASISNEETPDMQVWVCNQIAELLYNTNRTNLNNQALAKYITIVCIDLIDFTKPSDDSTMKRMYPITTINFLRAMMTSNQFEQTTDRVKLAAMLYDVYEKLIVFTGTAKLHAFDRSIKRDDVVNYALFDDRKYPTEWWQNHPATYGEDVPIIVTPAVLPVKAPRISGNELSKLLNTIPLATCEWARYSLTHDIPMPIGAIGFRLHKQFDMGSAFMMDARGQAGYTYFGFADFQLGDR